MDLSFRSATDDESDFLADTILGDSDQETTRVALALYGIDDFERLRPLFRTLQRSAQNWRHTDVAVADGRPVGLVQTGEAHTKVTPRIVMEVTRALGARVLRVPLRLRIEQRVAPAKPADAFVISQIFVVPEFRDCGIGAALLGHAERCARQQGYNRCALHTLISNPARRLYERHGYVPVQTTADPQFEKLTGVTGNILYIKTLTASPLPNVETDRP